MNPLNDDSDYDTPHSVIHNTCCDTPWGVTYNESYDTPGGVTYNECCDTPGGVTYNECRDTPGRRLPLKAAPQEPPCLHHGLDDVGHTLNVSLHQLQTARSTQPL